MKYLIVLVFIIVFSGFNQGYSVGSTFITHLTFNFSHVSWLHLVLNSIAYIGVFRILQKTMPSWWIFFFSFVIATTCSFFAVYSIPTMGASGMIYAMIGMYFAEIINKKLVVVDKRLFNIYIVSVILALSISLFNPHSAFGLHILCLTCGCLSSIIIIIKKEIKHG